MSAISSISSLFQGFSPLGFIRVRFAHLGALIRWIGQRLVGRDPDVLESIKDERRFHTFQEVVERFQGSASAVGDVSLEQVPHFQYLLEGEVAKGEPAEGMEEFKRALSCQLQRRDFDAARASLARLRGASEVNINNARFEGVLEAHKQMNTKPEDLLTTLMLPAAAGDEIAGYQGFEKDAFRTAHNLDSITVEGIKFESGPKLDLDYKRHIDQTGRQDSNSEKTAFYASQLTARLSEIEGIEQKWIDLIQCVIHQDYRKVAHREFKITPFITEETPYLFGQNESFPKTYVIDFDRDMHGEIVALNVSFKSGYRAQDVQRDGIPVGFVEMTSRLKLGFQDERGVRVLSDDLAMNFSSGPIHAFTQINHIQGYYRSGSYSLADGVAKWSFWGANALSFGYLEQQSIFTHLDRVEEYIRRSGHQSEYEIRERLGRLRRLYGETGIERYRQAAHAMVRALFEREITHLDYRNAETKLSASIERQFRARTEHGDLRMFVGDNATRGIMKSDVVFKQSEEHPYARYNSESAYYAGDEMGAERRYFKALQKELHLRASPVRDMVQALMTQDITFGFTADLFAKTQADGYALPGEVPGAAESSIVVRSDERITYVFKTRYDLLGTDRQPAGQIAVDVALDLRYENETWVPRIVKRDIKVIHDM